MALTANTITPDVGPTVQLLLGKNLSQVFAFTKPGVKVAALNLRAQGEEKPFLSVPLAAVDALCDALQEHLTEAPEILGFITRIKSNAAQVAEGLNHRHS